MVRQRLHIGPTLAQWRDLDWKDRQPEEEVLSKLPCGYRRLQLFVGGRHDADIHLQRLGAADPFEGLFFERAQDLGLQRQRHVANFVEKQRPVVRQLEASGLARIRAGKRALFVAEQFGFEQSLGNGGAVDGDKRAVGSGAERVQCARVQLLAGAAFAEQQHGGIGCGGTRQRGRHPLERWIVADDRSGRPDARRVLP